MKSPLVGLHNKNYFVASGPTFPEVFLRNIDMEIGEIISYATAALGGGGIATLFNWRLNKRQKKAEVKKDEIDNINAIVESVYKPMIESLKARVDELDEEVRKLREEREQIAEKHEQEIATIKEDCVRKSEAMRQQIFDLAAQLGKKADKQSRAKNGQYIKSKSND